jgi:hypothetical protein
MELPVRRQMVSAVATHEHKTDSVSLAPKPRRLSFSPIGPRAGLTFWLRALVEAVSTVLPGAIRLENP